MTFGEFAVILKTKDTSGLLLAASWKIGEKGCAFAAQGAGPDSNAHRRCNDATCCRFDFSLLGGASFVVPRGLFFCRADESLPLSFVFPEFAVNSSKRSWSRYLLKVVRMYVSRIMKPPCPV